MKTGVNAHTEREGGRSCEYDGEGEKVERERGGGGEVQRIILPLSEIKSHIIPSLNN